MNPTFLFVFPITAFFAVSVNARETEYNLRIAEKQADINAGLAQHAPAPTAVIICDQHHLTAST